MPYTSKPGCEDDENESILLDGNKRRRKLERYNIRRKFRYHNDPEYRSKLLARMKIYSDMRRQLKITTKK